MQYEKLYTIIQTEFNKRFWSYADAQKNFGLQKDVPTRLKQGLNIDLVSFILIIEWLHKECNWEWNKLFEEIL